MPKSRNQLGQELWRLKERKGLSYKEIVARLRKRANENSKAAPYEDPSSVSRFFLNTRRPPRSKLVLILTWGLEMTDLGEINRVLELAEYEVLSKEEIESLVNRITTREIPPSIGSKTTPKSALSHDSSRSVELEGIKRRAEKRGGPFGHEELDTRFAVGSYRIADVPVVQVFKPPLSANEIMCSYDPRPFELPTELEQSVNNRLPEILENLRRKGHTGDLNDNYGIRKVRIQRPVIANTRRNQPELWFEPSNFKYYLGINEVLDKPLLRDDVELCSIRQRYVLPLEPFEWSTLQNVPFHMLFGTVTAVITVDEQLIISIRSNMQAITEEDTGEEDWMAALSCAEGMLRPADSDGGIIPSPFNTCRRSLGDELNLEPDKDFATEQIKLLGIFFDTKRYQPVAVFFVRLPELTFEQVREKRKRAKDSQENLGLVNVPVGLDAFSALLLGRQQFQGKPLRLLSNHQQTGVLLTALHLFKESDVEAALHD